jgi:hypothetical protein
MSKRRIEPRCVLSQQGAVMPRLAADRSDVGRAFVCGRRTPILALARDALSRSGLNTARKQDDERQAMDD